MCKNIRYIVNPTLRRYLSIDGVFGFVLSPVHDHSVISSPNQLYSVLNPHKYYNMLLEYGSKAFTFVFPSAMPDGSDGSLPCYIESPCGHCEECLLSKSQQTYKRLLCEASAFPHEYPLFITLTYDNFHIPQEIVTDKVLLRDELPFGRCKYHVVYKDYFPSNPDSHYYVRDCESTLSVARENLRLFLKRLHINLQRRGLPNTFRHFFVTERGSKTGRIHFHGLLFCHGMTDYSSGKSFFYEFCDCLNDSWNMGFTYVKSVYSNGGLKYVAKYIFKNLFLLQNGRAPEQNFWTASRVNGGLGTSIVTRIPDLYPNRYFWNDDYRLTLKCFGRSFDITVPTAVFNYLFKPRSVIIHPDTNKLLRAFVYFTREYDMYTAPICGEVIVKYKDLCPEFNLHLLTPPPSGASRNICVDFQLLTQYLLLCKIDLS